jgi:hypothetical protein
MRNEPVPPDISGEPENNAFPDYPKRRFIVWPNVTGVARQQGALQLRGEALVEEHDVTVGKQRHDATRMQGRELAFGNANLEPVPGPGAAWTLTSED